MAEKAVWRRVLRVLLGLALVGAFFGACGDDDDDGDDAATATTGASGGSGDDPEPDDEGCITEGTWIAGEVGTFEVCDVTESDDAPTGADVVHVWAVGIQEADPQDPATPAVSGMGPHDHVVRVLDEETPCALFAIVAGDNAGDAELVLEDSGDFGDLVKTVDGEALKDSDEINTLIESGVLAETYLGLSGTCTSAVG